MRCVVLCACVCVGGNTADVCCKLILIQLYIYHISSVLVSCNSSWYGVEGVNMSVCASGSGCVNESK